MIDKGKMYKLYNNNNNNIIRKEREKKKKQTMQCQISINIHSYINKPANLETV